MMFNTGFSSMDELLAAACSGKMELVQIISAAESLIIADRRIDAVALYRAWLKKPTMAVAYAAWFNLGVLLSETDCHFEAESAFREAIALRNDFLLGHYSLGVQLERQGRQPEAIEQWKASLSLESIGKPENSTNHRLILNNLGRLYDFFHKYEDAEEMLRQSLASDPAQSDALYHWLHLRQKQCKWPVIQPLPGISAEDMRNGASPLAILAISDDPVRLLKTSSEYSAKHVIQSPRMVPQAYDYRHDKIRIAFVSGDFTLHAVSLLTVRLFELIDRDKFDVYGFGWGRADEYPFRKRVVDAFDHFTEISALGDDAAAELIKSHEIDVLIDLQGLTSGARYNLVARGPAPFQIAYLGYPGTSAIPNVDYVVADEFIFPTELTQYFTERPLYLRDCFQVSDDARTQAVIDDPAQYGLPPEKFVFCAFNNNFKITPEIFESWMRILRRAPDSILWLLSDNEWAEANMRRAAQIHGIDVNRLYFAGRVAPEHYLSRFGVAHIFLDTFPYNAGTTANDALWAGLPIVTLSGRAYVSRMAGSLLRSVGLEQLIATTHEEYENKAIEIAHDRALQVRLKERLQAAKANSTAFNTQKFATEFGIAIEKLLQREDKFIEQKAAYR
jgi:predicted O-linked N-acetylglucosamine transferase (SPINDLY family)